VIKHEQRRSGVKKVYLALTVLVLMLQTGCSDEYPDAHRVLLRDEKVSLVEVDGCQYVLYHSQAGRGIIHHENCPNPRHQKNN
jgi:hypothetical protein